MIKWEKYRDQDGYIDICQVYFDLCYGRQATIGANFLVTLSDLQGIKSRQAAGIAIATAQALDGDMEV